MAVKEANVTKPTPAALAKVRHSVADALQALKSIRGQVRRRLLESMSTDPAVREKLNLAHCGILYQLGYTRAPEVEKSLIHHVANCWLRLQHAEVNAATHPTSDFWDKQLTRAQRRFLKALETLARLRRVPVQIMVNMAQQQVNMIGTQGMAAPRGVEQL